MSAKKSAAIKRRRLKNNAVIETDSSFFLKLVLYIIVGSVWLRLGAPLEIAGLTFTSLPIGLGVGLLFASHDHFQIDRKIEYAILLMVTIGSFFLPMGIVL